jgi:hypothetical protein
LGKLLCVPEKCITPSRQMRVEDITINITENKITM